ncbi:MAG: DivIVA domain-containing protein, partial [Actinomycetes bacterium]
EDLRAFEREYRTRLRSYLEGQLRELDSRSAPPAPAVSAPATPPGPVAASSAAPGPATPPVQPPASSFTLEEGPERAS